MTRSGRGTILSRIIAAGIAALAVAPAQESTPRFLQALASRQRQTVVTYGTSLTANSAWPEIFRGVLHDRYGKRGRVINAASGGKDSRWGLAHVHEKVAAKRPDVVFIEFAINDALAESQLTVDESVRNHEGMIAAIRAVSPDCEIFLMVMNPPTGAPFDQRAGIAAYEEAVRRTARKCGTGLIDFAPAWSAIIRDEPARWAAYAPDGLHPSAAAAREVTLPVLLENLGVSGTLPRRRPVFRGFPK